MKKLNNTQSQKMFTLNRETLNQLSGARESDFPTLGKVCTSYWFTNCDAR